MGEFLEDYIILLEKVIKLLRKKSLHDELDKLIFLKKLKNKDKTAFLDHTNRIVKKNNRKRINHININNLDLEDFDIIKKLLDSNNKKEPLRLSKICLPTATNAIVSKVIPMTGAISKFKYNISKDESHCDPLNMLLLGLDSNIVSFSDILGKIDIKSKTRFQEQTLGYRGKESIVEGSPMLLNNGYIVQDTYRMNYAPDSNLTEINGETRLIMAA